MDYRVNPLYDPEPHYWCCHILWLDDDAACAHLWLVHGLRRGEAEATLAAAKGDTP